MSDVTQEIQTILHIDMDAFFASVEELDHPEWVGKPIVVGSPPDKRGVVSTANYEARKYGIHSAMPSRTAYKLCPGALFVPVRMKRYLDVSERVMNVIYSYSPIVEQVSVDEAFVDIRGVLRHWDSPEALAVDLKNRMKQETGLTASIGIANNKYLAKLASDFDKPDGLTVLPVTLMKIRDFLAPLPVNRIWGVGKITENKLHAAGFRSIGDLQNVSPGALSQMLGPALANHIGLLARGEDLRPVITESETKSISAENTFDIDVDDTEVVRRELVNLVEQVGRRLRRHHAAAKTIYIKIRYEDFQTVSRQETFSEPLCSDRRLLMQAIKLLDKENITQSVRLIGFGVTSLTDDRETVPQMELFGRTEGGKDERDGRIDRAVDKIKDTMGSASIRRGSSLGR